VLNALEACGGRLPFDDNSDSELIQQRLKMSKKTFKKAIGNLMRLGLVKFETHGVTRTDKPRRKADDEDAPFRKDRGRPSSNLRLRHDGADHRGPRPSFRDRNEVTGSRETREPYKKPWPARNEKGTEPRETSGPYKKPWADRSEKGTEPRETREPYKKPWPARNEKGTEPRETREPYKKPWSERSEKGTGTSEKREPYKKPWSERSESEKREPYKKPWPGRKPDESEGSPNSQPDTFQEQPRFKPTTFKEKAEAKAKAAAFKGKPKAHPVASRGKSFKRKESRPEGKSPDVPSTRKPHRKGSKPKRPEGSPES